MDAEDEARRAEMQRLLDELERDPDKYGTWPPPQDVQPEDEAA